jgi:hypothetical protein
MGWVTPAFRAAVFCGAALVAGLPCAAAAQARVFGADPQSWLTPQGVAAVFQQACVRTEAQNDAAVDWALTQGFEPLDALSGSAHDLLEGQPGAVLAAPASEGRVMLVVTQDRRCTVWAQRVSGPALRLAVAEALGRVTAGGARVQLQLERNIERSGAWRNQMQWRYRAVGGSLEFGLGAVTTLTAAPATQALNMAPWQAAPPAPDGMTGR